MLKHLAIWYLRKRNIQLIMNIDFLEVTRISGAKSKDFYIYDNDGEDLTIYPNYEKEE